MTTSQTEAKGLDHITMDVVGMHCNGCANTIQTGVAAVPGVASATVDLAAERLDVEPDGTVAVPTLTEAVAAAVAGAGYSVKQEEDWS